MSAVLDKLENLDQTDQDNINEIQSNENVTLIKITNKRYVLCVNDLCDLNDLYDVMNNLCTKIDS